MHLLKKNPLQGKHTELTLESLLVNKATNPPTNEYMRLSQPIKTHFFHSSVTVFYDWWIYHQPRLMDRSLVHIYGFSYRLLFRLFYVIFQLQNPNLVLRERKKVFFYKRFVTGFVYAINNVKKVLELGLITIIYIFKPYSTEFSI